ncbi:hypothetical protein [Methylocella sp.]|jgi:hypothetical protein|uniref:hypothetical protein n=1 Tax=Methylocella sp. TaxID=1978226 RepID=UPI003C2A8309
MKILSIAFIGAALVLPGCVAAKETHAGLPVRARRRQAAASGSALMVHWSM